MNWRRGLFRLWLVGAALFVIAVASISYSGIKAEFVAVADSEAWAQFPLAQKPNIFSDIGKPKFDFSDIIDVRPPSKPNPYDAIVADAIVADSPNPWASVGKVAGIAFGVPVVVLALGASLAWAFSGFGAGPKSA